MTNGLVAVARHRATVFTLLGWGLFAAAYWAVDPYTLTSLSRILSLGLLAASVAILTGLAGLPTLGQVAPYAVGAYTAAVLARAGVPLGPAQLLAAALAAGLFSAVVGTAVVQTRGMTFLVVSLAVGELVAVGAGEWTSVTGGTDGLAGIPAAIAVPGGAPMIDDRAVYAYTLVVATVTLALAALVLRSPAGVLLRGSRDHEARMRASGHPVGRYLLLAYTGAGVVAGIGGALLVTGQRYVSPQDIGFEIAALVLLAVTLGGPRSIGAAVVAVALVVTLRQWADGYLPGHGPLLLGLLFVIGVYVLPGGLAGLGGRDPLGMLARRLRGSP